MDDRSPPPQESGQELPPVPVPAPVHGLSTPVEQAEVVERILGTARGWLEHVPATLVPQEKWDSIRKLAVAVSAAIPWVALSAGEFPPPPGTGEQPRNRSNYEAKRHAAGWARFIALKHALADLEASEAPAFGQPISEELEALRKKVTRTEAQYRRTNWLKSAQGREIHDSTPGLMAGSLSSVQSGPAWEAWDRMTQRTEGSTSGAGSGSPSLKRKGRDRSEDVMEGPSSRPDSSISPSAPKKVKRGRGRPRRRGPLPKDKPRRVTLRLPAADEDSLGERTQWTDHPSDEDYIE
jgi:hypothetical protein